MKINYVLGFLAAISLNISAEIWKDYSPSEEIVEMTVVKVKANYVDDYLVNLKSTWVDSLEVQKKLGHIISYNVWTAETAGTTPNVFLTVRYKNAAAREPNKVDMRHSLKSGEKFSQKKSNEILLLVMMI